MAGTAGLGPLLIIVSEMMKYYTHLGLQLFCYPLTLVKRLVLGDQRTALRGSVLITGCDTGIGRFMALMLADKVLHTSNKLP